MAIPDYQTLMLPLLEFAGDGREHRSSEATAALALRFGLTAEERESLLPSGKQTTIANRVGWAKTYLAKAGLLDNSRRGVIKITELGLSVLASKPARIDNDFLAKYEGFEEFRTASRDRNRSNAANAAPVTIETPEELLEQSYSQLQERLADEILARTRQVSPARFESIVLDVLLAMGYGGSRPDAGRAVGRSGDGGIDGLINEDPLGLDVVYIQAKRWEAAVGRPVVQAFVGSLEGIGLGRASSSRPQRSRPTQRTMFA